MFVLQPATPGPCRGGAVATVDICGNPFKKALAFYERSKSLDLGPAYFYYYLVGLIY